MPVEWKEPPAAPRSEQWQEIADELRSRPGAWALVARDKGTETATRIRTGALVAFRPVGAFEARTSNRNGNNRVDIYARYVGDE